MKNTHLDHVHLLISGKVQGVGFRYATHQQAKIIGVNGWVRNTDAGDVEAVAQGTLEQLTFFVEWCRKGPAGADVAKVRILKKGPTTEVWEGFEIRR